MEWIGDDRSKGTFFLEDWTMAQVEKAIEQAYETAADPVQRTLPWI